MIGNEREDMIEHFNSPEHKFLSNFYPCSVEFRGKIYPSVEHAYQSAKSESEEWKSICTNPSNSAMAVKKMSDKVKLNTSWHNSRVEVMRECLIAKFSQEPLKTQLLNTGDEDIQEGGLYHDPYWSVHLETKKGQNMLGRLLMDVRSIYSMEVNF